MANFQSFLGGRSFYEEYTALSNAWHEIPPARICHTIDWPQSALSPSPRLCYRGGRLGFWSRHPCHVGERNVVASVEVPRCQLAIFSLNAGRPLDE